MQTYYINMFYFFFFFWPQYATYRILAPDQVLNPCPVPWKQSLNHWTSTEGLQFSHSVMSDSLWPHGLQHTRLPCPSLTPRACWNSCPSSQWCNPTISSSVVPFSLLPSIFASIRVFSNESVLHIRWPKYWSFSFNISPSNEYSDWFPLQLISGLISFPTPQFKSINSLALSFLYSPTLTSIHDYWKNHSFD